VAPDNLFLAAAGAGGWNLLNGILHDIFVLLSEKGKKYDRDLLRLLMDGHILMTCGLIQIGAGMLLKTGSPWALYLEGIACLSMIVYCLMIFPFLKSFGTLVFNTSLLVLLFF
jgi:hypothetical protein